MKLNKTASSKKHFHSIIWLFIITRGFKKPFMLKCSQHFERNSGVNYIARAHCVPDGRALTIESAFLGSMRKDTLDVGLLLEVRSVCLFLSIGNST